MKNIYMNDLKEALENSSVKDYSDLIDKIDKRYNLGIEAGLSEEEIEEMLGDVDTIVDQYLDSLIDEDDDSPKIDRNKDFYIEINTIKDDISIELVDTDNIEYVLSDINIDYYEIVSNNNEFKIKYKKGKFLGLNRKNAGFISLKIPKNIRYDKFIISNTSGDITINNGLNSRMIRINSVSGDINFDNIDCNNIKISVVSGDITGLSINGRNVYVDSVSGDMTVNLINCDDLSLSSISGDFNISHVKANIKASTVTGDILVNNETVGANVKNTIKGLFR